VQPPERAGDVAVSGVKDEHGRPAGLGEGAPRVRVLREGDERDPHRPEPRCRVDDRTREEGRGHGPREVPLRVVPAHHDRCALAKGRERRCERGVEPRDLLAGAVARSCEHAQPCAVRQGRVARRTEQRRSVRPQDDRPRARRDALGARAEHEVGTGLSRGAGARCGSVDDEGGRRQDGARGREARDGARAHDDRVERGLRSAARDGRGRVARVVPGGAVPPRHPPSQRDAAPGEQVGRRACRLGLEERDMVAGAGELEGDPCRARVPRVVIDHEHAAQRGARAARDLGAGRRLEPGEALREAGRYGGDLG